MSVLEQIEASGKWKDSDIIAMDMMAADLEMWYRANDEVKKYGITIASDRGNRSKNPAIDVANISLRRVISMMGDYGLTALARKRLERGESKDDDKSPLADFLMNEA